MSAKITFSSGVSIDVKDGDILIPIISCSSGINEPFARQGEAVIIEPHVQLGLIPSIMDVLTSCDFFYACGNYEIVYGSKSIISVENN